MLNLRETLGKKLPTVETGRTSGKKLPKVEKSRSIFTTDNPNYRK
jgi:hypothetical protein